jgi:hypothetical protein
MSDGDGGWIRGRGSDQTACHYGVGIDLASDVFEAAGCGVGTRKSVPPPGSNYIDCVSVPWSISSLKTVL